MGRRSQFCKANLICLTVHVSRKEGREELTNADILSQKLNIFTDSSS